MAFRAATTTDEPIGNEPEESGVRIARAGAPTSTPSGLGAVDGGSFCTTYRRIGLPPLSAVQVAAHVPVLSGGDIETVGVPGAVAGAGVGADPGVVPSSRPGSTTTAAMPRAIAMVTAPVRIANRFGLVPSEPAHGSSSTSGDSMSGDGCVRETVGMVQPPQTTASVGSLVPTALRAVTVSDDPSGASVKASVVLSSTTSVGASVSAGMASVPAASGSVPDGVTTDSVLTTYSLMGVPPSSALHDAVQTPAVSGGVIEIAVIAGGVASSGGAIDGDAPIVAGERSGLAVEESSAGTVRSVRSVRSERGVGRSGGGVLAASDGGTAVLPPAGVRDDVFVVAGTRFAARVASPRS